MGITEADDLENLVSKCSKVGYRVWKISTPKEHLAFHLYVARRDVKDGDVEESIRFVRKYMEKVTLTPLQKQSLEEELSKLLFEGYKKEAAEWLKIVKERSKTKRVDNIIHYIYDFLKKAKDATEDVEEKTKLTPNIWLAKRNESDETIRQYRLQGHKKEAEKLLARARKEVHEGSVKNLIDLIRDNLKKGKLEPEGIKTSWPELNDLLERGNDLQERRDRNRANGKKKKVRYC